jgi:hypothetical protein
MPHFFRVLENIKNKEYGILIIGKQVLVDMPYLPDIKMEFSYIIFNMQMGGNCVANSF